MKSRWLLLGIVLAVAVTMASCAKQGPDETSTSVRSQANTSQQDATRPPPKETAKQHGHDYSPGRVPAFQTGVASLKSLPPTLQPESFTGKTREAYKAVKEIPQTIAQLPCYCYCDEGHGHKSLHSCYEDTHASQCAVCVDEALMAYQLEKQQKLKPEQIRERIVAQYAPKQQ